MANTEQFWQGLADSYRQSTLDEMASKMRTHNAMMSIVRAAHALNSVDEIAVFKRTIVTTLEELLASKDSPPNAEDLMQPVGSNYNQAQAAP